MQGYEEVPVAEEDHLKTVYNIVLVLCNVDWAL